jgi:hypothetical protein
MLDCFLQSFLVPAGITLRSEKDSSLIIIYAMYLKSFICKILAHFRPIRPDEPVTSTFFIVVVILRLQCYFFIDISV